MTPTPRAGLKALFAAILNMPATYVVWKGEVEPSGIKPTTTFGPVLGATNATPIVLTVNSTLLIPTGMRVQVDGVLGNTGANGTWFATVIDASHVQLDGSVGNGAYTSGGTVVPQAPLTWAMLRVGLSSREAVGWDNVRRTDNLDGTFVEATDGRRVLNLGFDLFSYDSESVVQADDLLEQLVTRLQQSAYGASLNALGCVYETEGAIIPLPTTINGRDISAAHVDIKIALGVLDTTIDRGNNRWIREVIGTATVTIDQGVQSPTYDVLTPP